MIWLKGAETFRDVELKNETRKKSAKRILTAQTWDTWSFRGEEKCDHLRRPSLCCTISLTYISEVNFAARPAY